MPLVHALLNPFYVFLFLLLASGLFYYLSRYRLAQIAGFSGVIWLLLVSCSPLPGFLTKKREQRYQLLHLSQEKGLDSLAHVVVLGAGHSNAPSYPVYSRLSEPALKRLLEGVRIHQALPGTRLVCSGYSKTGRQSQAEALAEMALQLGVSPTDTILQPHAVNTEAEARTFANRFGSDHRLVLVTSALHMPRAMFWFQHHDLDPIPAPTNHLVMPDPGHEPFSWKPSLKKIEMTQKLLHEYAGMLYAQFKVGIPIAIGRKSEGGERKYEVRSKK